jgi:hypothetical protein
MSTPHPLEDEALRDPGGGFWDPWDGPAKPHWYSGLGFTEDNAYVGPLVEGLGAGAAKGEAVLGGLVHGLGQIYNSVGKPRVIGQEFAPIGTAIQEDARQRTHALTPDAATVGTAAQVLHGVGEGGELFALGGAGVPGALSVGAGEGFGRFQELREHGVEPAAAAEAGGLTAVTGAAGAMLPGGFGSRFLTRLLTGAAANTTFGVAGRYADHLVLKANGYDEMAEQQRAWDGTQLLADAVLGATFGVLHHMGAPDEMRSDAARATTVALQDRRSAPGVAVDPEAASVHQAALETATEQLMQGKPVDVSDVPTRGATFARRAAPDTAEPMAMMADALRESGFLHEETSLADLEKQLEERQGASVEPRVEREIPEEPEEPKDNTERALEERPDMQIPDESGELQSAREALETEPTTDFRKATEAAVNCYSRKGG